MIVTTDIANILYKLCKENFGIDTYQFGSIPRGEVTKPRITIHVKASSPETWWKKGFAEVNFSVPNIEEEADLITLQEYERMAYEVLNVTEEYDGSVYKFRVNSTETFEDTQFKCHYVNARVLYEVLNVK